MRPALSGGWWNNIVKKEADRDRLGTGERLANMIGIFFIIVVAIIFLDVQTGGHGFFTDSFGPLEQLAFYGSLFYGIVPILVRALIGRRNLARLADAIGSVVFVLSWSYLLTVFPFDFSALWDYLPTALGAALSWVSDDMIRLLLVVGIIISVFTAVYNLFLYWEVRHELRGRSREGVPPT